MAMSTKFSGVKKFCVGTDVIGWDLGGLFSPVTFLFFRFLSWNPSVSSTEVSVDWGPFVWEVPVSLSPSCFGVIPLD